MLNSMKRIEQTRLHVLGKPGKCRNRILEGERDWIHAQVKDLPETASIELRDLFSVREDSSTISKTQPVF